MSIIDVIFIALTIIFFLMVLLYALGDLFRDLGYYRRKQKNVVSLKRHVERQRNLKK